MAQIPEEAYWLALAYTSQLKLFRTKEVVAAWCLERGRPLAALFDLPPQEMASQLSLSPQEGEHIHAVARQVPEQAAWLTQLARSGIQLITRADTRYPRKLPRCLPQAMQPLLLFCQGNVRVWEQPSATIIGARGLGPEMIDLGQHLATLLAEEGLAVISGLGKGLGKAVFDSALLAEGGQALTVLPMGIEAFASISDPTQDMADAIDQGRALLLSPFHPQARFSEAQAIARNKLLVGLAEAAFVIAVGETGVARDTANEALRLGKAVYVWDLDLAKEPAAAGNQALIQAGGLPIASLSEVMDAIEAVVERALDLRELTETPAVAPPSVTQLQEPEAPYDPQAALDLLSKAGKVPEALAKRLRGGKGKQESDHDHP